MKAKIMIKYLIDKYIRKDRATMSEKNSKAKIGSISVPPEVILFKKNNPQKLSFAINLLNLDTEYSYTVIMVIKKNGKEVFKTIPPVFNSKNKKKLNSDQVTSLTMTVEMLFKESGQYEVEATLLEVLKMDSEGEGFGQVTDIKLDTFVAEESK